MPYKPDYVGGPANVEVKADKIEIESKQGIELNASNKKDAEITGKTTDQVQTSEDLTKFASTDDKRTDNNYIWPIDQYTGADDVALRYKTLTDEEKTNMMHVKMAAQHLINTLRKLGNHPDITLAIRNAQLSSMWGTRFIAQSNKV